MLTKFLDPKNDFAFKRVFGTEKNKDILIQFLNDILNHRYIGQISEVTFLPPCTGTRSSSQQAEHRRCALPRPKRDAIHRRDAGSRVSRL